MDLPLNTVPFDTDNEKIVTGALRPKDAATLVLVKRESDGLRVLMGKRHGGMAFMANKYVFPGGRMDPGDARIAVGGDLKPHVLEKLTRHVSPQKARGLALAAIRETFEEAGVLVGQKTDIKPRTKTEAWKRFFEHGVVPRLDRLEMIARAITPPNRTRRFDARFFMASGDEIAHVLKANDNDELLTPCWVTLEEARVLDLPSITRRVLDEVELRADDGPDVSRPVPFFRFRRNQASLDYL
ncbi:MAG: NUDIX hydrolase [Proteobacteria bacterium]|nr:NUDIX hydrolase [Pseudomonadota bacterium]